MSEYHCQSNLKVKTIFCFTFIQQLQQKFIKHGIGRFMKLHLQPKPVAELVQTIALYHKHNLFCIDLPFYSSLNLFHIICQFCENLTMSETGFS